MWAGTTALQAWTPDQTKQARVISAPTLPSSSSIYIIPRKNQKQTNKQDKKLHNRLETKKSQMNITFFRLFIKCFWWLLKQEAWKERKKLHWTIINISVGIYVHHKKLHIKKKQNKQTTHLVIKSECK